MMRKRHHVHDDESELVHAQQEHGTELQEQSQDESRHQYPHVKTSGQDSHDVPEDSGQRLRRQPSPEPPQQAPPPPAKSAAARVAGEYEPVRFLTLVWISYISLVCGCINAVSISIYTTFLTHLTGVTTRMSIGVVDPGQAARIGFSSADILGIVISYGVAAFLTGLLLTNGTADGKWSYIKLDYPNVAGWKWQHQLLTSLCIVALAVAGAIVHGEAGNIPKYQARGAKSPAFLTAIMLSTFAASILNGFLTLSQIMLLRASHLTGTMTDMFYGLGFAVRSRNCRFMWKVHLLFWTFAAFVAGAVIGANAYHTTFKYSAVLVPVIMLAPTWLFGAGLLVIQLLRRREAASAVLASIAAQPDNANGVAVAVASDKAPAVAVVEAVMTRVAGEYEPIDIKYYAWAFYVSFIGGSINALALEGIFEQTVTHVTGLTTRMGMYFQYPPSSGSKGGNSYSADDIVLLLLVFGLSASVCGFTLTTSAADSADTRLHHLKMDYPKPLSWSWKHQILVSLCIIYLGMSHSLVQNASHGDIHYIDTIGIDGSINYDFFEACLLATAASATLNSLLSQGNLIALRASHVTGTVHDIFLGLGFAVRSRSLRLMWRVRLLSCSYIGFFVGGIVGSVVYQSTFGPFSLIFPVILLAPVWLGGAGFLALQLRREHLRRLGLRATRFTSENFNASS